MIGHQVNKLYIQGCNAEASFLFKQGPGCSRFCFKAVVARRKKSGIQIISLFGAGKGEGIDPAFFILQFKRCIRLIDKLMSRIKKSCIKFKLRN